MKHEEWLDSPPDVFLDRWYEQEYADSAYSGPTSVAQSLMHRSLERGLECSHFQRVLELGANAGEHFKYVRHGFQSYIAADVREGGLRSIHQSSSGKGQELLAADGQSLPFTQSSLDRVLHMCLLHHVPDPELLLTEIRRVLVPSGQADIFVSGDPGLLFRAARALGPLRTARKSGMREVKTLVDARDHRNHAVGIIRLIRHVFRDASVDFRSWPIPYAPPDLALWHTARIVMPRAA